MLTNEEVIEEMLKRAKQIAAAQKEGGSPGLTADELAFYDALTKPQAIKDFYENDELIAITKELADTLQTVITQCEFWTDNMQIIWRKRRFIYESNQVHGIFFCCNRSGSNRTPVPLKSDFLNQAARLDSHGKASFFSEALPNRIFMIDCYPKRAIR